MHQIHRQNLKTHFGLAFNARESHDKKHGAGMQALGTSYLSSLSISMLFLQTRPPCCNQGERIYVMDDDSLNLWRKGFHLARVDDLLYKSGPVVWPIVLGNLRTMCGCGHQ